MNHRLQEPSALKTVTHIKDVLNTATSMNITFYSGLAAYVYLESVESRNVVIPGGDDIEGQARFSLPQLI